MRVGKIGCPVEGEEKNNPGGAGGSLSFGEGEEKNQTVGGWRLPPPVRGEKIRLLGFLLCLSPQISKLPPPLV